MLPCPAVGATPNPLLRAPAGREARRRGLDGDRLPRHRRAVRRASATPRSCTCRPAPSGDPTMPRIFAALVGLLRRPRPEQRLVAAARPRPRRRDARPAPRPRPQRRAARGRPADHRHRRRPQRPAADLADRRRAVRRLRLPHVRADADSSGTTNEVAGVLGLRRPAVHHRLAVAQLPRRRHRPARREGRRR